MEIKIEEWNGYKIRFVEIDGEWWAVAKDVAKALAYRDSNDMTKRMESDEVASFNWKKKQTEQYAGCFQDYKYKAEVPIISEFGIYEAILNNGGSK
ncbi:BRO-N domain-containing protein [Kroppenstedtia sanguinis]|uniref:Bro-N domain-containing protein n=1 Tax=Kroppenstedtia sanguinis TaxID=1380684 RepID=A0ABW4C682_9BACL